MLLLTPHIRFPKFTYVDEKFLVELGESQRDDVEIKTNNLVLYNLEFGSRVLSEVLAELPFRYLVPGIKTLTCYALFSLG